MSEQEKIEKKGMELYVMNLNTLTLRQYKKGDYYCPADEKIIEIDLSVK